MKERALIMEIQPKVKLEFSRYTVEVSAGANVIMIYVANDDDKADGGRSILLFQEDAKAFISVLNMFIKKLEKEQRRVEFESEQ
jgi:hypothetical protein